MAELKPFPTVQELLDSGRKLLILSLGAGRTKKAASMALLRGWRRAQDIRLDRRPKPLRGVRVGRRYLYPVISVEELLSTVTVVV